MQSRIWIAPLMLSAVFVMQPTDSHAQAAIGKASSVKPQADGSVAGTLSPGAACMPAKRLRPEVPARQICVLMTVAI